MVVEGSFLRLGCVADNSRRFGRQGHAQKLASSMIAAVRCPSLLAYTVAMKVYLDTCVLMRLFDQDVTKDDLRSLEIIADNPDIVLVTSDETYAEISKEVDQKKRTTYKLLYRLIEKTNHPSVYIEHVGGWGTFAWGEAPWGGGTVAREKPLYTALRSVFPDEPDVKHIAQASMEQCEYFLTFDVKTIISKAKANAELINNVCNGLAFLTPEYLVRRISKAEAN